MITYSHQLYALCEPLLGVFERRLTLREPNDNACHEDDAHKVLLFGLGRFGTAIGLRLQKRGIRVLGIDFNPQALKRWRELGLDSEYGDATDPEFVTDLPLDKAEWVLSTMPSQPTGLSHEDSRITLIQLTRTSGFVGRIAALSHSPRESELLSAAGADVVLEPFQDAADRVVELLCGAAARERTPIPDIPSEEHTDV
jgi:Trk K+ transport system NAD-binding subunit